MQPDFFLKGSCNHCEGHIEFPPDGIGQSIDCPHCGEQTNLIQSLDTTDSAPAKRKTLVVMVALGSTTLLATMAIGIYVATNQTEPASQRLEGPPAKISSNAPSSSSSPAKRRKTIAKAPKKPLLASVPDVEGLNASEVIIEKSGGRLIYALGTVRNETQRQRFGVTVNLDLFDAQGNKIGSATDYTQVIEPQNEWRFKALVTDRKAVRAKITGIKEN